MGGVGDSGLADLGPRRLGYKDRGSRAPGFSTTVWFRYVQVRGLGFRV